MGSSILARAVIMAVLTLVLTIPLGMIGGVISDRQKYKTDAVTSVTEAWGGTQTFSGPIMVLPYRKALDGQDRDATLTLLPERLTIDGQIRPEQRRRGLFGVTVYTATLDVIAEFQTRALQELLGDGRQIDWRSAHIDLGLTDVKSIDAATLEINGERLEWGPGSGSALSALRAGIGAIDPAHTETITVRFRLAFAGSGSLTLTPLGRRTEANMTSSWPSPSFIGRTLPSTQSVGNDGFKAKWSTSHLGRPYGQLWDSATTDAKSRARTVIESTFGVTLLTPVDAYRETDRAMKYGIMFVGLTFAACLLVEMATGTRPHPMQNGLIGLALCVFYLLLLSLSEQIGFAAAYLASAAAVVVQATIYSWTLHRRRGPALAFGAVLAGLYGGLYGLLQLQDVALLTGSLVLFAVLSFAMWFTRNLHRVAAA